MRKASTQQRVELRGFDAGRKLRRYLPDLAQGGDSPKVQALRDILTRQRAKRRDPAQV